MPKSKPPGVCFYWGIGGYLGDGVILILKKKTFESFCSITGNFGE